MVNRNFRLGGHAYWRAEKIGWTGAQPSELFGLTGVSPSKSQVNE